MWRRRQHRTKCRRDGENRLSTFKNPTWHTAPGVTVDDYEEPVPGGVVMLNSDKYVADDFPAQNNPGYDVAEHVKTVEYDAADEYSTMTHTSAYAKSSNQGAYETDVSAVTEQSRQVNNEPTEQSTQPSVSAASSTYSLFLSPGSSSRASGIDA